MSNETCPHCGDKIRTAGALKNDYYLCWTNVKRPSDRDECCYERQIKQQAAEIERLKAEIEDYKNPSKNIWI